MDSSVSFPDPEAFVEPLLVVADLPRALAFWVGQLGRDPLTTWDEYALLSIGSSRLHLAVTGDPPPDRSVRLVPPEEALGDGDVATGEVVLRVRDCRAVVLALEARGVAFLGPPARPSWGRETRAFLRDPDGHLVEITSAD